MKMKVLLEVEVETEESADPKAVVSGIIDKLGDGEIIVPSVSAGVASMGVAQVKELRSYNKASQSATW